MSELPEIRQFIADVERSLREVADQPEPEPDAARLDAFAPEARDAVRAAADEARGEREREQAAAGVLADRTAALASDMVADLAQLMRVAAQSDAQGPAPTQDGE